MAGSLSGTKVAILVANGFEQSELMEPKKALEQAGAQALIISPVGNQVRGWNHKEWGDSFPVDVALNDAQPGDYSALLLPGGVMNPDYLRWNARAVTFVKSFVDANKPIAAICPSGHQPQTG
jgi:protease I